MRQELQLTQMCITLQQHLQVQCFCNVINIMMNSEEILTNTISNGEVEVNVSPVGTFYGSDAEGNAISENLTEESLQRLADQLNASNQQILVDADHASCRPGIEKDTSACGWLEKFFVKPLKGLWAKLKLTNKGRDLVENKVYRFLSPVFKLDDNGEPIHLNSVAMTNCPALAPDIAPIINAKPSQEILEMTITKEDLVNLIKETVNSMKNEKADVKEEVKEEIMEETAENACSDKKEVTNSETEEVKEEIKEKTMPEEEEEKKEVITIEALNSAPKALTDVSGKAKWMNLHGDAFWKYLSEHPEIKG